MSDQLYKNSIKINPKTTAENVSYNNTTVASTLASISSKLDSSISVLNSAINKAILSDGNLINGHIATFYGGKIQDSGYTIASNVPANAVFTDTTYPIVSYSNNGIMSKEQLAKLNELYDNKNDLNKEYIDNQITTISTSLDELKTTTNNSITSINTSLSNKQNKATTLSGYNISDAYTKDEIDIKVSSVLRYKGTVDSISNLPSNPSLGDVYNVKDGKEEDGFNYAWNGKTWDSLGKIFSTITTTQVDALFNDVLPNANYNISSITIDAFNKAIEESKEYSDKAVTKANDILEEARLNYLNKDTAKNTYATLDSVTMLQEQVAVLTTRNLTKEDADITYESKVDASTHMDKNDIISTSSIDSLF